MQRDTDAALGPERFPVTRESAVLATRSADVAVRTRGMEALIRAYWRPVYKHLRVKWRAEPGDAKDLTQAFFARALEGRMFERYDPAQARFRTFLRTCLDRFVSNERKAARRQKRGGDVITVPLDWDAVEGELEGGAAATEPAEEAFTREWARSLFELAVTTLRERCEAKGKQARYRLFERYDIEAASNEGEGDSGRLTYQDLAREAGVPVTQITNELAAARRELRSILLEMVRDTTGSDAEYRDEVHALLGHDPR